jgi:hypothetical protein
VVRNRNTQNKQEREADHIAEGFEKRGVSGKEAERRAWATVNKARWRRQEKRFGTNKHTGLRLRTKAATRAVRFVESICKEPVGIRKTSRGDAQRNANHVYT